MKKSKVAIISILTVILLFIVTGFSYATGSTTSDAEDKKNNYLKSLSVEGYEISPEFNKNTMTYYLVVPTSITSVNVLAETESENATVKISGNTSLRSKENTVKVVVTAKNRTTKTYSIIVTRQDDNGLKLSSLRIEGGTFQEEFNESKYNYTVDALSTKDVTDLKIDATANVENAEIEIIGNTGLEAGVHLVTILLKSGSNVTTYEITVNLSVEKTIITEVENNSFAGKIKTTVTDFFKDENKTLAFLIAVAVVLFVFVLILIVKIKNKNKAEKNRENLVKRAKK